MKPKFSIVIPVHNRRDYLAQALASCIGQTVTEFEVVVCDDCSSENLAEVVESCADARIRYTRNSERLGAVDNHQRAASLAQGEYVLILHSDDFLLPHCLQTAGEALDANAAASAVYYSMTYLIGSEIEGFHVMPRISFADKDTLLKNQWLEKFNATAPTCCVFRRSAFNALGGYRTSLRFIYDYDLYMRFLTAGGVIFLPQILCVYRKHGEQMTWTSNLDGLTDLLDLWCWKEYSHWPASDVAEIVLTQLGRLARTRHSFLPVLAIVRQRGLTWRLLRGMPKALQTKLRRRAFPDSVKHDSNYQPPIDPEQALQTARMVLGKL
jgi:glycosyltransferase involved in cell wall biosynthesis